MTTTITRAVYRSALVQLPDEPRPRRRQFVVLAEGGDHAGLHAFSRPGPVGEVVLPINWDATSIPSARDARNGIYVTLTDGRVVTITPGGCSRCGTLGRWPGPSWAVYVAATSGRPPRA